MDCEKFVSYLPKKVRDNIKSAFVELDFDYQKNRTVQHYFVELLDGTRFDATTIADLKCKAKRL